MYPKLSLMSRINRTFGYNSIISYPFQQHIYRADFELHGSNCKIYISNEYLLNEHYWSWRLLSSVFYMLYHSKFPHFSNENFSVYRLLHRYTVTNVFTINHKERSSMLSFISWIIVASRILLFVSSFHKQILPLFVKCAMN